jgi:hypothetical protein
MAKISNLPELENLRNKKEAYHIIASKNDFKAAVEEDDLDTLMGYIVNTDPSEKEAGFFVKRAKLALLQELAKTGGDTTTPAFKQCLEQLTLWNSLDGFDARKKPSRRDESAKLEGTWITLSKPQFSECLGTTENEEFLYSLGRMSFDMFLPTKLVCSIQGTFNRVKLLRRKDVDLIKHVPASLKAELDEKNKVIRTYDIVTAFTIEAAKPETETDSPNIEINKPIKGLMTTNGYVLANPQKTDRLSIWFTGGAIECNGDCDEDTARWKKLFGNKKVPARQFWEKTRYFAANVLMGAKAAEKMEPDGKLSYSLERPIGGHDTAYVDLLYLDSTLRIARSHNGIIYAFGRVPKNWCDDSKSFDGKSVMSMSTDGSF